jgi:CO/xanthine dehydrogenase Mo-binding subunit
MNGIGDSPPRPDGFAKVSGAARYVDDVTLPGMWHGATVRSPHPHARVRSIRFDPEAAPEGAVCVTAADLPGPNGIQLLDDGWPILADGFVLHVAEPVALVAAPTRLAARQALAAVQVEYEPLAPVLTLEEAASLPPLYELRLESGDVDAALAEADHVIEGTWRTGHQEHIYIECQGMIATCEEGGALTVLGSMDGGAPAVAQAVENATGIPVAEIPATPERLLRTLTPGPSPVPSRPPSPGEGNLGLEVEL